ncbi:MAG: TetR/AcrR family transcriptional regulator [Steroidobacteraceae bacterium]|jgi:AcrR family transcriptional regulator|nr:TetR/AcrR family transcriptional regulator [Steroidobacteraceae bacterium]
MSAKNLKPEPVGAPARGRARKTPLGREAWLQAAREALIREGIRGVEIGKLARRLKVTRGGFYWFFDSRKQLLDELLADWERTNSAAFKAVLRAPGRNGMAEFQAIVDVWINEAGYSPAWDAAVRDWARVSAKVANAVRRVDDERIAVLQRVFEDMGYPEDEAFVRARVTYFHQVGYYALGVEEPRQQRLRLLPLYTRILTGR